MRRLHAVISVHLISAAAVPPARRAPPTHCLRRQATCPDRDSGAVRRPTGERDGVSGQFARAGRGTLTGRSVARLNRSAQMKADLIARCAALDATQRVAGLERRNPQVGFRGAWRSRTWPPEAGRYATARAAMAEWLGSPGHRHALLGRRVTVFGVGSDSEWWSTGGADRCGHCTSAALGGSALNALAGRRRIGLAFAPVAEEPLELGCDGIAGRNRAERLVQLGVVGALQFADHVRCLRVALDRFVDLFLEVCRPRARGPPGRSSIRPPAALRAAGRARRWGWARRRRSGGLRPTATPTRMPTFGGHGVQDADDAGRALVVRSANPQRLDQLRR